eukprot:CAMPEP_0184297262 /NCGR_PEP_ID=MMETSP1049-20130417/8201_1 /TAXON_ID=77928 /ORGANISM="Proteomonas sulcata, Strain CCMP704" /LENGTH=294 /DNA_ID=CAMNT_0026606921 /DNA_START=107 /DNA_END=991 /DNA_ORIENTATION=+
MAAPGFMGIHAGRQTLSPSAMQQMFANFPTPDPEEPPSPTPDRNTVFRPPTLGPLGQQGGATGFGAVQNGFSIDQLQAKIDQGKVEEKASESSFRPFGAPQAVGQPGALNQSLTSPVGIENLLSDLRMNYDKARSEAELWKQRCADKDEEIAKLKKILSGQGDVPSKDTRVGIGMMVGRFVDRAYNNKVYILKLQPNTPAADCGQLAINDMLMSINGTRTDGMDLEDVSNLILGPPGSTIVLQIVRVTNEGERVFKVTLNRKQSLTTQSAMVQSSNQTFSMGNGKISPSGSGLV